MNRYFEPELRNDFIFIFKKENNNETSWYEAVIYAEDSHFDYHERHKDTDYFHYVRTLKPNHYYEIIGKVYQIEDYDDMLYPMIGDKQEVNSYNQIIYFVTNEHGDIDLESVDFWDY